jgi:hypothetical protein
MKSVPCEPLDVATKIQNAPALCNLRRHSSALCEILSVAALSFDPAS